MLHGHVVSNHKSHNHGVLQVFVGGVPRGATEEQIKEYASKVGPVSPESADRSCHCIMTFVAGMRSLTTCRYTHAPL